MLKSIGRKQQGATLVEILVAVLVLSVGVLGLAALQVVSLRNNADSYRRTQATNLGYQIMDELRVSRIAALAASGATGDQETAWDDLAIEMLPEGDTTIAIDAAGRATVSVTWVDDRTAEDPDDRLATFTLESRI